MSEEYTVEKNSHGHYLLYSGGACAEKAVTHRQAEALRKKFFEEVGLWLDSETGALVVVDTWYDGGANVVRDRDVYFGDMDTTGVDGQIVRRWRESLVPPPRMPEVGEVWRVTLQDESEHNVVVRHRWIDDSLVFVGIPGAALTDVEDIPPDRRRIVADADGNVVQDV